MLFVRFSAEPRHAQKWVGKATSHTSKFAGTLLNCHWPGLRSLSDSVKRKQGAGHSLTYSNKIKLSLRAV